MKGATRADCRSDSGKLSAAKSVAAWSALHCALVACRLKGLQPGCELRSEPIAGPTGAEKIRDRDRDRESSGESSQRAPADEARGIAWVGLHATQQHSVTEPWLAVWARPGQARWGG